MDNLASALKIAEAGICRPKQLSLGHPTLYRELASIRRNATPDIPLWDTKDEICIRRRQSVEGSRMKGDTLFLVGAGFVDPAYPGQIFYCWHCALIEGVLASFPILAARLDVQRLPWPRPRNAVIELVGRENQSLPLLVLAEGGASEHQTGTHKGRAFISDKDEILATLSERHNFPNPHP